MIKDEKTKVKALDRTQPTRPMKPGQGRMMTHDDGRNGGSLVEELNIASGEAHDEIRRRQDGDDVMAFPARDLRAP